MKDRETQRHLPTILAVLCLLILIAPARGWAGQIIIDTVPVGNSGNAPDPRVMTDFTTGYGSVDYDFRMGKYEVTNRQYATFLNAVDPTGANALELYDSRMATDANGGIEFSGAASDGMKYAVKNGRGQNPVVWANWYNAIRFANWLHNGQGSGSTESGAYTLLGGTPVPSNAATITRNAGAKWFLPSEDEWYKAAYHQPAALGGNSSDYWLYPTKTNATPDSVPPPGAGAPDPANAANIHRDDGVSNGYNDGYAVTGLPWYEIDQNFLTDVGAYTLSSSFYGTFDQAGNVFEWVEQAVGSHRVLRGGGWLDFEPFGAEFIAAFYRGQTNPHGRDLHIGFRVATVPEPSALILAAAGAIAVVAIGRTKHERKS